MDKIPCIRCTPELWEYITPYLDKWGYIKSTYYCGCRLEDENVLVINAAGSDEIHGIYIYNNYSEKAVKANRELVTDVKEFLERAAKLKGFTYKRKDVMEINGIEIKPGMGIYVDNKYDNNKLYIVIPTKLGLAVINYGQSYHWLHLDSFLSQYKNRIVAICDLATQNSIIGDFLWVAPEEIILTMDDIAKKFGYNVEQIKIVK